MMAPIDIRSAPINMGNVIRSFSMNAASIMVKTKLSLSIGDTCEAVPI